MKKIIRLLVLAAVLVATLCCLSACKTWQDTYVQLAEEGYDVIVRYDTTGGKVANIQGTVIKDVYTTVGRELNSDGTVDMKIYDPHDPVRGIDNNKPKYQVTKDDHTLIGWYTHRELRTDENGNALDEYGQLCSETGREQGYIYSGKWDFENDVLKADPNTETPVGEATLTLYAAWAPRVTYEIYYELVDYGQTGASDRFQYYASLEALRLSTPQWIEGEIIDNSFPVHKAVSADTFGFVFGQYYTEDGLVYNDSSEYGAGFVTTKTFSKEELPIGTIISISADISVSVVGLDEYGVTKIMSVKNTTEIKVTESWWGNDTYKAFNICLNGHTEDEPSPIDKSFAPSSHFSIKTPLLTEDTFYMASLSADFETTLAEGQSVPGAVDEATGTLSLDGDTVKVYTKWLKGTWFKIETKADLSTHAVEGNENCNFIIECDINFKGKALPTAFFNTDPEKQKEFNGQIIGNGHKFYNIAATQSGEQGGLFYAIGKNAKISDLTIESATYKMVSGATKAGNSYGLLAGVISADAVFENVSIVDSKLVLTSSMNSRVSEYNIGLLCGNPVETGIDISGITLEIENDEGDAQTVTGQPDSDTPNGDITVIFTAK